MEEQTGRTGTLRHIKGSRRGARALALLLGALLATETVLTPLPPRGAARAASPAAATGGEPGHGGTGQTAPREASRGAGVRWVEFLPPWDDAEPTATDMSFLLDAPAGKHGRVVVCGGHLCLEDGTRARFWGVNLNRKASIPDRQVAEKAAARLAKLGINAVRFGDLDGRENMGNLLDDDPQLRKKAMEQLDRFDYFVTQLKHKGIYSYVILNSGSSYLVKGIPDSESLYRKTDTGQPMIPWGKYASLFDPLMIERQKAWIEALLTHRNPYTGLTYAEEPALAFLEIGNENSLFRAEEEGKLTQLPDRYAGQLATIWRQWQKSNSTSLITTTTSVRKIGSLKPEVRHDEWRLITPKPDAARAIPLSAGTGTRIEIHTPVRLDAIQYGVRGLNLDPGWYVFRMKARADTARSVTFVTQPDDWRGINSWTNLRLTSQWTDYEIPFNVPKAGVYRAALLLGDDTSTVEVDRLSLAHRPADQELQEEAYLRFLMSVEARYFRDMTSFIKQVGYRGVVIGTNGYGWPGLKVQSETADAVTQHMYWDPPRFPREAWSRTKWAINNNSMLEQGNSLSPLVKLAWNRILGKPFIVTEFGDPNPNDFGFEAIPLAAVFARKQDWDGVFLFKFSDDFTGRHSETEGDLFNMDRDPGKLAVLPLGAAVFLGQGPPAYVPTSRVTLSEQAMITGYLRHKTDLGLLTEALPKPSLALDQRVGLAWSETPITRPGKGQPMLSSGMIEGRQEPTLIKRGTFLTETDRCGLFIGRFGQPVSVGPFQFTLTGGNIGADGQNLEPFVAIGVCGLPAEPGKERWLITAVQAARRPQRNTLAIPRMTLRINAGSVIPVRIFQLDDSGRRNREVPFEPVQGWWHALINEKAGSPWHEVELANGTNS